MPDTLNETEHKILVQLLDRFDDVLGNAGCNDLELPDTDEGRALYFAIEQHCCKDDAATEVPKGKIWTMDFMTLSYLRSKLGLTKSR